MKRKVIFLIIAIALIGGVYGYYLYNKPVDSMKSLKAVEAVTADFLIESYQDSEAEANERFLDKVITVTGEIQQLDPAASPPSIYLKGRDGMSAVICEMEGDDAWDNLKEGQTVEVKGLCTGYLMDVVLIRCILNKE